MEVKINVDRRFFFDALMVLNFVLLIAFGYQLTVVSKSLAQVKSGDSGANGAAVAAAAGPSANQPSAPSGKVKGVSSDDYVRGDKNAPLTLIEYSDFECPFCKRFHPSVLQLLAEYPTKLKAVYRHYPLSFHQNAEKEAEASECVQSLGGAAKFYDFGDKIFARTTSNGTGFALTDLPKLAAEVGVNKAKFQECLDSGKFAAKVQKDIAEGSQAGVSGTPSSFVMVDKTGQVQAVEGAQPYQVLKQAVEAALKTI